MIQTLQVRLGDEVTTLVLDEGQVTIEDRVYTVRTIEPGLYRVDDGTRRWTVAVAGPADNRWVFVDGVVAEVEVTPEGARRRRRGGGGGDHMAAPMPATVVSILVGPGSDVAEGDTLIILEAMKMELPIRAPRAGVVATIRCAVGELVQPGVNLLEIE